MKTLGLSNSVINIQKCLLPDSEFLRNNYGRYCRIALSGHEFGILAKIGLSDPRQLTGCIFIDYSVVVYKDSNRTKPTCEVKDVEFQNFQLLQQVSNASTVNATIVFNSVTHLVQQKAQLSRLKRIIKEILKLYIFSQDCVIFLDNLSASQRNDIYCIDIHNVNKESAGKDFVYNCTEKTDIIIDECVSRKKYEMCFCPKNEVKLGGLSCAYEVLKEMTELSRKISNVKFNNKILLIGPPGCGKTSVIHNVVRDCKTVLLEILLPEICSSLPGETERNLKNIFDTAKLHVANNENCIILIEDIDALCIKQKDVAGVNLKRTVHKLVSLLDDFDGFNQVFVIATTTNVEDVDPVLRRAGRFDDELEIMTPTKAEREEIIANIFDYYQVTCSQKVIQNFALWTPGFVGADLHMAIQESILLYNKHKGDFEEQLLENCFKRVISNITPTPLRGSVGLQLIKDTDFSNIGGLNRIKKLLQLCVKQQLIYPQVFSRMGIPLTKGILLYGPPGCAKTSLVKALAKESNMTFLSVSSADLYSPYVGDPERKILQLFSQARIGAPSIIFIDEIDGLVGSKSGDRTHGVQERVLSTLLIEMDGISVPGANKSLGDSKYVTTNSENSGILVIGATNRPERLDAALKRPGRFDKIVYVPPPDESERLNILKKLTEKMPLSNTVDLQYISRVTNYYSGADLKNLCYESALLALTDSAITATCVNQSHFQQVLSNIRPSLNSEMIAFYELYH